MSGRALSVRIFDEPEIAGAHVSVYNLRVIAYSEVDNKYFSLRLNDKVMSNILSPHEKMLLRQPEHKDALLDRIVSSLDLVESKGETGAWQWSLIMQNRPVKALKDTANMQAEKIHTAGAVVKEGARACSYYSSTQVQKAY